MADPAGTAGSLRQLAAAAGRHGGELPADLDRLLVLAGRAAPSCLAVSVTTSRGGAPVTVTAFTQDALLDRVRASLALRLPARVADGGGEFGGPLLVLYAGAAGAFTQTRLDLLALLDLDPAWATVDGHLELPTAAAAADVLAGQLDDVSAVDRALGVLLDRGLLLPEGHRALDRLAAARRVAVPTAARVLLSDLAAPSSPR